MGFREIGDCGWELTGPLLPPRPRVDDRRVLNGCRWMDMPVKYGSYKTAWDKFKRWSVKGVWADVFKALIDKVTLWVS